MSNDKFWGTIDHLGKTYAIVGPDGSVERVRAALGTVAAVRPGAGAAPLPIASLGEGAATKKEAEPVAPAVAAAATQAPPQQQPDGSEPDGKAHAETLRRAKSGRFDDSKGFEGSRYAMVRAPARPDSKS